MSLRGSLLRSPWGVRNVKVYLDEFPLTDAGGNTYLSLIDPRGIGRLEVLKGPHGSLFGANSGGVLLIDPAGRRPRGDAPEPGTSGSDLPGRGLELGISGGSYGMVHQSAALQQRAEKSRFSLNQAFLRSDGYRENSAQRRHYLQASHRWDYRPGKELKVLAFYADQEYATPGGLNEEQYRNDPRQARPAAGPNPGAVEQQAGIENQTFFGGISHASQIGGRLRHVVSVFGSHTDLENPFITNYEVRDEDNYGFRTYLELDAAKDASFSWKWHLGLEWQRSHHDISNFDNEGNATKGNLQASDRIRTRQHFYFVRFSGSLSERLRAEAAVSLNYYRYAFQDLTGGGAGEVAEHGSGKRRFSPEWMPSLSFSYLLGPALAWRTSLSRGYSPPTTAEIRPSNILINTDLEAETGWNYETGFRFMSRDNRFHADASVFYYRMQEAIVRRLDEGGNEYFVNSGGTDQSGLESMLSYWITPLRAYGALRGLQLRNGYTYSYFRFGTYVQGSEDHSGNRLTGVPRTIVVSGLALHLPETFLLSAQHNYTSRIPLDDANSTYAGSYHLVQLKLRWQRQIGGRHALELFAGVDNLLNERYSLGNDINAFG
ncbi:MAG TPA: TonB-dependent receptor, partial [Anseongella sp.]|nr:TonB-dependent receptor [Anseongella sp.]